jgi:hypothetical protein
MSFNSSKCAAAGTAFIVILHRTHERQFSFNGTNPGHPGSQVTGKQNDEATNQNCRTDIPYIEK